MLDQSLDFAAKQPIGKEEVTQNLHVATRPNCLECIPTMIPYMADKVSSSEKLDIILIFNLEVTLVD